MATTEKKIVIAASLVAVGTITATLVRRAHKKIQKGKIRDLGILLDWDLTPIEITESAILIITQWRYLDDVIAVQSPESATFTSTFGKMIELGLALDPLENAITFPKHVSTDALKRDAAEDAEKKMSAFSVESSMRRDVYLVLKAVADKVKAAASSSNLSGEEKRYAEKTVVAYEQNGMHLEAAAMKEVEILKKEISELEVTFSSNIAKDATTHLVTEADLDGCPADFIASLDKQSSKLVLTMDYPHYMTVSKLCRVPATRQAMEAKFNSRCKSTNVALLERICSLRHEAATKLGYASHAHHKLLTRMSKTPDTVKAFLSDLSDKLGPLAEKELAELRKLKKEVEGGEGTINMWDFRFYLNLVEERHYSVDHNALRQYFPFDAVLEGMLGIYRDAFGLVFTPCDSEVPVWHPDVLVFRVSEEVGGALLGYFYLDLWPRPNKFSHAACWPLQPSCSDSSNGSRRPAVTALVCNFPKPSGDGKPPLLEHNEVVTFFHEFGHGVHNLCSKTSLARFAGTSTERDFVEAPSQMLENWCWESEPLKRLSKHALTHQPIPSDLVEKLVKAKNANVGLLSCRQLFFGIFDQTIHSMPSADTASILTDLHTSVMRVPMTPGTNFSASFGHMCGYDAQYYGYMWSEVFSDDMFQSVFKHKPLDRAAGRAYCEKVLAKGGSEDALVLLCDFLGREPSQEAFLSAKGLSP